MSFFFKKRIKLFPGCYINLSKSGIGFSFGPKGLKYSINSKGEEYISSGESGLYFREKIDKNNKDSTPSENKGLTMADLEEAQDRSRLLRANAMRLLEKQNAIKELENKGIISPQECAALLDTLRKMN